MMLSGCDSGLDIFYSSSTWQGKRPGDQSNSDTTDDWGAPELPCLAPHHSVLKDRSRFEVACIVFKVQSMFLLLSSSEHDDEYKAKKAEEAKLMLSVRRIVVHTAMDRPP
eukprot:GHVU01105631.1.p4 GENE.GHVU01105631.1~~GHVU01105631.1.p4  ORF type:complete len:110 (+),score=11.23 GHVU01105631.1:1564-1893(+)